jgi:hypothetical protein
MTNLVIKDGNARDQFIAANGAGTDADPLKILAGPQDFMLELACGNIAGVSQVNKFGASLAVTADTTEDIWDGGGTYAYPATALMVKVSQTVDQSTMRGATIEVQGLDANWALVVQDVVLDASLTTTPVVMTTPLIRVFRMKVMADVVIDSPIRCHNAAEDVDYAVISIGNNQTLMALYTVPAGKTAFITSYFCDSTDATNKQPTGIDVRLWMADRANSYEFQLKHSRGIPKAGIGFQHFFAPYIKINEKTDIKITALPTDEAAAVHAGFDLILVDD